ncbi:hypothetical protein EI94DRAFT_1818905 [Lactarius quietus]|nr:hypothetical protein EI94DRAFT_1818905 [Lactarius quietus]
MAPSLVTSTTSLLPLAWQVQSVRCQLDLPSQARKRKYQETADLDLEAQNGPRPGTTAGSPYTPVQRGLASLATISFLSGLRLTNSVRCNIATPLYLRNHPLTQRDMKLLDVKPSTIYKAQLQVALQASNEVITLQKQVMAGMQAQTVLQSMYLEGMQGQLQAQKEKKLKKRKTGKINMDGRAKILTQDDIIDKKKVREQYSVAMDTWKAQESSRKERNTQLKVEWEVEVKEWNAERDSAKLEHWKPKWMKPRMPAMEKAHCKPLLADFTTKDPVDDDDDDSEGDLMLDNGEGL